MSRKAEPIQVSGTTRVAALSGAIAGVLRENGQARIVMIGEKATYVAIKAICLASRYLTEEGRPILWAAQFEDAVSPSGETITAICVNARTS